MANSNINRTLNTVSLAGRLTSDPKESQYNLSFTVAIDRGKDKQGKDLPAYFIPVQIGRNQFSEQKRAALKKGVGVVLRGSIRNEEYTAKDGKKNYFFCVAAEFLSVGPVGRLNHLDVHGNLVEKPELQTTAGGASYCNFRIGLNRSYEKDGKWVDVPSYVSCTAWNGTAEAIAKYFDKGSPIILSGELESRSYKTKEGEDRTAYSIRALSFSFAAKKGEGQSQTVKPEPETVYEPDGFTEDIDYDSDIPF